jgi:RNA polymerase sigma-70 factor (ECF subfamily)
MNNISLEGIQKGDVKAYQFVFNELYEKLCKYAFLYVDDEAIAKDLVQELFVKLWERRQSLQIKTSLQSYLFSSTKNICLNHIRDNKGTERFDDMLIQIEEETAQEMSGFEDMDNAYYLEQINLAINSLPLKCKEIFLMSRKSKLTYAQIAEELNISKKTVENQMGIALKKLKDKLSPILFSFVFFL